MRKVGYYCDEQYYLNIKAYYFYFLLPTRLKNNEEQKVNVALVLTGREKSPKQRCNDSLTPKK